MNIFKSITVSFLLFFLINTSVAQTATQWDLVGPYLFPTNESGQINGIGRVCQVKFHPTNPLKMYAVSASGGLWISNDTAHSWLRTGTDNLPATACASVCVDYTNDSILYLGTGDPNYYGTNFGIWKSVDGGSTWAQSTTGMGNRLPIEILMDPTNHNTLVAATDIGIYKSTNAGATWNNVLSVGDFKDMQLKPGSNSILYAVTSSEFYRSADFGNTWNQITNGIAVPGGGSGNGMRIAVSNADPAVIYIGMEKDEGTIFKSVDNGTSFSTVYHNPARSLTGYDTTGGGQGNYNFSMTCDPTNANNVFLVSHVVWRSTDGGVNWTQLTNWYAKVHTDMHGICFHPTFTNKLFNANDGGVWLSTDAGANWIPRSDGLDATEIYHASQSPIRRDMMSIGTQDNGELYFAASEWKTNRGGDWGSKSAFDYLTNNVVYYNDNGNRRPVNGSESYFGLPDTTTDILEFPKQLNTLAFAGKTDVWRTLNLNSTTPTWTNITNFNLQLQAINCSPADSNILYTITNTSKIYRSDNALAATPTFVNYNTPASTSAAASITAIKNNVNHVYISCGNKVFRSINKGQTWTNITYNLPAINIIKIFHDVYNNREAIYACSAKGVYYKDSTMNTWQNISYNLPTVADIHDFMFYNPGSFASVLRVAYYGVGVWELPINTSFPPAPNFVANKFIICPGQIIQFTDMTIGTPTSWSWSFLGGTPSTSSQQNPSITYPSSGVYPVTLSVTNANGTNSFTQTSYITVSTSQVLPFAEGFETVFPPANWENYDANSNNIVWQQSATVGGFGASAHSAIFDNYDYDISGQYDELRTPQYDFTSNTHPLLTFDRAYARWSGGYYDSLAVLSSSDCGITFNLLYLKGYSDLATAPDFSSSIFIPQATEWKKDTIDLSSLAGQNDILFAFQNRGHYGQAIYIDNINLSNQVTVSIPQHTMANSIDLYPNPNNGEFTVDMNAEIMDDYTIEICNTLGQVVYSQKLAHFKGNYKKEFTVDDFGKGIYFLNFKTDKTIIYKKLVVN